MSKVKWLSLECDLTLRKITQKLLGRTFDVETGRGFRVTDRSKDQVAGTFIERVVTFERIVDPFGTSTDLETVRYILVNFRLHLLKAEASEYLLEVSNPPRSIRSLIANLSDAVGSISVGEMKLPILEIYSKIKKDSPRAKIVKLKANGIPISSSSAIQVEVSSTDDALADFRKSFPAAADGIEKIRIERPFSDSLGYLEIGANGLCGFDEFAEDRVRAIVLELR